MGRLTKERYFPRQFGPPWNRLESKRIYLTGDTHVASPVRGSACVVVKFATWGWGLLLALHSALLLKFDFLANSFNFVSNVVVLVCTTAFAGFSY